MAEYVKGLLEPYCERIAIAGSLRRRRSMVGDVELVCVPKVSFDLFGNNCYLDTMITHVIENGEGRRLVANGPKYKKFMFNGVSIDLFLVKPEEWGVAMAIRTGSADFSRALVTPRRKGGLLPSDMRVKDNRIWHGKRVYETPEEIEVFKILKLDWIVPEDREMERKEKWIINM